MEVSRDRSKSLLHVQKYYFWQSYAQIQELTVRTGSSYGEKRQITKVISSKKFFQQFAYLSGDVPEYNQFKIMYDEQQANPVNITAPSEWIVIS